MEVQPCPQAGKRLCWFVPVRDLRASGPRLGDLSCGLLFYLQLLLRLFSAAGGEAELCAGAARLLLVAAQPPHTSTPLLFLVKAARLQQGVLQQGVGLLSPPPEHHGSLPPSRQPVPPRPYPNTGRERARHTVGTAGVNHFPWQAELAGWFAAQQHFPGVRSLLPWAERWDKSCTL